jgi:hypothetical protein
MKYDFSPIWCHLRSIHPAALNSRYIFLSEKPLIIQYL